MTSAVADFDVAVVAGQDCSPDVLFVVELHVATGLTTVDVVVAVEHGMLEVVATLVAAAAAVAAVGKEGAVGM